MDADIVDRMDIDVIGLNAANELRWGPASRADAGLHDAGWHTGKKYQQNINMRLMRREKLSSSAGNENYAPSYVMPEGGYFFDAINRSPGFDEDNLHTGRGLQRRL